MTVYEQIKREVSAEEAAQMYGLAIDRKHRALCPWHNDHRPSLTFRDSWCYCFVCNKGGDAVTLTAQLYGITNREAADKIVKDFHLGGEYERRRETREPVAKAREELAKANVEARKSGGGRLAEEWVRLKHAELELTKQEKLPWMKPFTSQYEEQLSVIRECNQELDKCTEDTAPETLCAIIARRARAEYELDVAMGFVE